MPSSITLCYTPTRASNRCCLKSFTSCVFCNRLAAPDFVMKCIEARAVRRPEVWKFYRSLTLLHFPTGGANDAQNVSLDTARKFSRLTRVGEGRASVGSDASILRGRGPVPPNVLDPLLTPIWFGLQQHNLAW